MSELSASKKCLEDQSVVQFCISMLVTFDFPIRLQQAKSLLHESECTCKDLAGHLEEVQLGRSSAESDLSIEKQWRVSLQVCIFDNNFDNHLKEFSIDGATKRKRSYSGAD